MKIYRWEIYRNKEMEWFKAGIDKVSVMTGLGGYQERGLEVAHRQEEHQRDFLSKVRYTDIDFFHLDGYECWARCLKQWDGDTVTLAFFLNDEPYKFRIRLADIDTAEKTSTNQAEVEHAMKAYNRLKDLIDNQLIYVKCHRWDKYGRLLAHLYASPEDTFSFNEILRVEGLAYEYKGGKRKPFHEWAVVKEQNQEKFNVSET